MRTAFLSDIHSNLEALDASLKALAKKSIDKYCCPGDMVGYGADPNECVSLIRKLGAEAVLGNHDAACAGLQDTLDFSMRASLAAAWTKNKLTDTNRNYLLSLPAVRETRSFTMVHASLVEPREWTYIMDLGSARECFGVLTLPLCFYGHTHKPGIIGMDKENNMFTYHDSYLKIVDTCRYIVNTGSVGQPRDGDPRACFVVYDDEAGTVEIERVEYDIKGAQEKIVDAGLPASLALRLEKGI